jgi:hypothetical protein
MDGRSKGAGNCSPAWHVCELRWAIWFLLYVILRNWRRRDPNRPIFDNDHWNKWLAHSERSTRPHSKLARPQHGSDGQNSLTSLKAEYINSDQLSFFVFRLQLCGGPYTFREEAPSRFGPKRARPQARGRLLIPETERKMPMCAQKDR